MPTKTKRRRCVGPHYWILGRLVALAVEPYVNLRQAQCRDCGRRKKLREREYADTFSGRARDE